MLSFRKFARLIDLNRRARRASARSLPVMVHIEVVEPRQVMSATAISAVSVNTTDAQVDASQLSRSQADTIDLAVRAVVYDATRSIRQPVSNNRGQFQVEVRIDGLTGREQNNVERFSITLYWARGPRLNDRIGVAASTTSTINHERHHAGDLLRIAVPERGGSQTVYRQPAEATHLVAQITVLSGANETDLSDNVGAVAVPTSRQLASQILGNANISLATRHVSGLADQANARANITSVAAGNRANLSRYENAPGGTTELDPRMMQVMLILAREFNFSVSEIAGGSHSTNSRHYLGLAFDVNALNGQAISSNHPGYQTFVRRAQELGAATVLHPGNDRNHRDHIHVEWPRDPEVRR